MGPRATATFLVLTALLFAGLLSALAWHSRAAGAAGWRLAAGFAVAAVALILAVIFARGIGEGRL